jgi:serpin B
MCYAGARSETASQLKDLLSVSHLSDSQIFELNRSLLSAVNNSLGNEVKISTANKLFPNKGFELKKEYNQLIEKYFHSEIKQLNFAQSNESAQAINSWVASKTNNLIKDLINPSMLNDLTRLVLVNAIYFKGLWVEKFRADQTSPQPFFLSNGDQHKVNMMKLYGKKFRFLYRPSGLNVNALELPYQGNKISMTIILPHDGHKLEAFEKQLSDQVLHEILTADAPSEKIRLELPRFKLEYKKELNDNLKALGATLPFDENQADFSGIADEPNGLYISKVVHQAVVEVNEEGTEAAAATGVVMMTNCAMVDEPIDFICNKPFLFVIHEKVNNNVLFYGKYSKPQ